MASALETAYQIGRYIQSFGDEKQDIADLQKPWGSHSSHRSHFHLGPNSSFNQMRQGLVCEQFLGRPIAIYTPFGTWRIFDLGGGNWKKVFEVINERLGLELLKKEEVNQNFYVGELSEDAFLAITRWEGKSIEMPEWKKYPEEYMPYEKVKEVWNEFVSKHVELTPSK